MFSLSCTLRLLLPGLLLLTPVETAAACTLTQVRSYFAELDGKALSIRREIEKLKQAGKPLPAELLTRRDLLHTSTRDIRRLFAREVEERPFLAGNDHVGDKICRQFAALFGKIGRSDLAEEIGRTTQKQLKPPKKPTPPCRKATIGKRFGTAIRRQRTLRIAGRLDRPAQMALRDLAKRYLQAAKTDLQQACRLMNEMEARLGAAKPRKPQ